MYKPISALRTAVAVVIMMSACACNATGEYAADTVMCDVNPFGWLSEKQLEFDVTDTLSTIDMSLAVRYCADLDADRLHLAIEFEAPDSSRFVERRIFPLDTPRKTGSSAEIITVPYRKGIRFSRTGRYKITLKSMEKVRGIEAVGFTFETDKR